MSAWRIAALVMEVVLTPLVGFVLGALQPVPKSTPWDGILLVWIDRYQPFVETLAQISFSPRGLRESNGANRANLLEGLDTDAAVCSG
ncbi:hypothetical protein GFPCMMHI_04371 [Ensifer adhaerens]|nr:hypothetical protein [Ensifer adhaerens]